MDRRRGGEFVGREAELGAFAEVVAAAAAGSPLVLLVAGDPGIGKTAYVTEAAARAGAPLFSARCLRIGGDALPLAPLLDLVRQVRRERPHLLERPELAPLREVATPDGGGARLGRELLLSALELVGALGEDGPAVVCFEDLHWADGADWDLFELLARNLDDQRVALVGTFRAAETDRDSAARRRLAELLRLPHVRRLSLGGLGRSDVARQASALLGVPAPHALVDELVRRGQGNPFFTAELVAAHLGGERVPAGLSDLLAADLESLDESARAVVAAVAVVGRAAEHDLVRAVLAADDDAVERGARAAVAAGVLVVDRATEAYAFRHALIGDVVLEGLLPSERRRLHRAVAEALDDGDLAEVALHLDLAGDRVAAFGASLAAADATAGVSAAAALAHLERALAVWDEVGDAPAVDERIRRLWQAAELANATGDNDRAVALARAAMALGPPPLGEAYGQERLARYLWAGATSPPPPSCTPGSPRATSCSAGSTRPSGGPGRRWTCWRHRTTTPPPGRWRSGS